MGDDEALQRPLHHLVAQVDLPGERLDLLAHASRAVEEQPVEILVSLAAQHLVRPQIQPALDPQVDLVEIAAQRGMGGARRLDERGRQTVLRRFFDSSGLRRRLQGRRLAFGYETVTATGPFGV